MKRFDFSKRHNISAICFIAIMIVTFVLCYSFPVVHAESNNTFKLSDYWFGSDFLLNENGPTETGLSRDNVFYNSQYPHATAFKDSSFYSSYGDTIKDVFDNYEFTFPSIGSNEPYNTLDTFITSNSNCYIMTPYVANPTSVYIFITHDGKASSVPYYGSLNASNGFAPSGPTTPLICYTLDLTTGNVSSGSYSSTGGNVPQALSFIYGSDSIYFTANNQDINYLFLNGSSGRGSGGFGGNYPDESAYNNLVFAQSDFIFTHQTYYAPYSSSVNTGSAVPVGTISFKGQPNDYQLEHPEEFTLQIRFVFEYDVDYKNQTGSEVSYFKKTSTLLNNEKNLRINFGNSQPYFIPLTTFIQNKNNADFVIKDVFDNLYSDGNSLTGLLAQSKEITSLSYNKFLITCYANIIANNQTSGGYIENYNFNSRMGATTTNNIDTNPNPYTPKPSEQASDDPDTSNITPKPNVPGPGGSDETTSPSTNTTTTTSNGGSQIVITNSPTFNNNSSASSNATSNGNGGGMIPTLLSYLSNGQQSSVSTMQNVADTNGWLNVVNSTYTFVPVSVWNSLIFYFGIALSILIVGFIISVVIKFIT